MSDLKDVQFAVIDIETTGLFPRADRILEIAILRINSEGEILHALETLVHPGRDLGPTDVHGIRGADVADAPRFPDIAGHVLADLSNCAVVGHNVRFNLMFLRREFERSGLELPQVPAICTLQMATRQKLSARRLDLCCRELGLPYSGLHFAAGDAIATAMLFALLLKGDNYKSLDELGCSCAPLRFAVPDSPMPVCSRKTAVSRARYHRTYLSALVRRLGSTGIHVESVAASCYLELIDRFLEDCNLEVSEAEKLLALAVELGMNQADVMMANRRYCEALLGAAMQDGIITDDEHEDLVRVADLLGVGGDVVAHIPRGIVQPPSGAAAQPQEDLRGYSVCFTGQTRFAGAVIPRREAERMATDAGLTVLPRVTKELDILVVADSDSLSGKAKKVREYGTRIMADTVFWQKLGITQERTQAASVS